MTNSTTSIMKFRFGTVVIASDGEAGSIASVVVQPGQRTITDVAVKLPGNITIAVPLERVVDAHSGETHLNTTREAVLQTMPALSKDATILSRHTQVIVNGNSLGTLTQVSMTTNNHTLHRLTIKRGMGSEVLVEANQIREIGDQGHSITCTLPAGTTLIPYRPDADLQDDVHSALWNYARLRVDLRAVQLRVIDGEVWLTGHVSSTLNRRVMSELLEGIKGLVAIHNELVADSDLAIEISRALADDPRTHGQRFGVYPNLGKVYLRGKTKSPEAAQVAQEIAAGVNHGQTIINELRIDTVGTFLPMLAPVTGNEDVIPGGD